MSIKCLLEEFDKVENVEVTGVAATFPLKRRLLDVFPMSRIRAVTARPAPQ